MMGRVLVAGLVVAAGLVATAATSPARLDLHLARAADPGPVLAFRFDGGASALAELDPATFRPVGTGLETRGCTFGWSFSPDRSRLVAGDNYGHVRVIGTAPLRTLGELRTKANAPLAASAWIGGRVLGVWHSPRGIDVRLIDPDAVRVIKVRSIAGSLQAAARTEHAFVLLLGPRAGVGPARLAILDGAGRARFVALPKIRAGQDTIDHSRLAVVHHARPGLAVDPDSNRAYVAAAGAPVAVVDLASRGVQYHELARPRSLLDRVSSWLVPAAAAKGSPDGPDRYARWLGDGKLAVYGNDDHGSLVRGNLESRTNAAGIQIVDTGSWTATTLDPHASSLAVAGGGLLATGSDWDSRTREPHGIGLVSYGPDGARRFHLFGDEAVYVQAVGDRAIALRTGPPRYAVVDATTGRVLEDVNSGAVPLLLDGDASSWVL
jgi:hypothetical protein